MRTRLLTLARADGHDFQLLLTRYANERLLYRIASSPHAGGFVLKGATLFAAWAGKPHRETRDLDLLALGHPDERRLRQIFTDVLAQEASLDGMRFDPDTLSLGPIRGHQASGGVRIALVGALTTARVRVQVDVGFGDATTPEPSVAEIATLLDFPAPRLLTYPRETVVAEKLEAMVLLGLSNSRMKDFYDVAVLARDFAFDGALLTRAIVATFERRKTALPTGWPIALTDSFANDAAKRALWSGFLRKADIRETPSLAETIAGVRAFVEAPLIAAATGVPAPAAWRKGWR